MSRIAGNILRSAVIEISKIEGQVAALKEMAAGECMDGRDVSDGTLARATAAGLKDGVKSAIDNVCELIESNIVEDGPVSKSGDV